MNLRIGIDLGGTKIEVIALDEAGVTLLRQRVPTPTGNYAATLDAVVELVHLVEAAAGSNDALDLILRNATPVGADTIKAPPETIVMLVVLGLIDVVMISNLLIMVIVGGYETFVSRMDLESHPDQPEWLSHVNASVLKVKLATAIIGISSIHLLKTFINAASYEDRVIIAQTAIHITFLLSALAIAAVDRVMPERGPHRGTGEEH